MSGDRETRSEALPALPFSTWLGDALAALREERPADVPCRECNACCRTSHFIHVRPEEKHARARIPRELLFPAPGLPPGNMVMGYDEAGRCPMLRDGLCTVYPDRPIACRTYDCRIYAAAGIDADRDEITAQVRRWVFSYPAPHDRELHEAVRAAARHISEHRDCLASEFARHDPVRVAVLALAVHDRFLSKAAPGRGGDGFDEAVARAVTEAYERLFGDI